MTSIVIIIMYLYVLKVFLSNPALGCLCVISN